MTGLEPSQILHHEQVMGYFQAQATYWRDVYSSDDLQATIIRERHAAVLDWIHELPLASDARVLEVGCGAGLLSTALALRGFNVQAIDPVQAMVEQTRSHAAERGATERVHVALGDVHTLKFPNEFFELVIAIGVIPWVDVPVQAIQELARVTRSGGYVIVSTANLLGLISQLDPLASPELTPLKRLVKAMLAHTGRPRPLPSLVYHSNRFVDTTLVQAGLVKMRGRTLGFGPFTLLHRRVLPDRIGVALHHWLQSLADRDLPGFRSTGVAYLAEARKAGPA
jgi:2-polyprenyl-3-methyl-5-hydroxy-6-metoxy-1,4-benzoquinol methylase